MVSFLYTYSEWVRGWMYFIPQEAAETYFSGRSLLVIAIGAVFLLLAWLRWRKRRKGK